MSSTPKFLQNPTLRSIQLPCGGPVATAERLGDQHYLIWNNGTLFERDGKRREVVRLIPADRFTSSAVEWRRPGQEFRSSACSVHAWTKWVKEARQIS